MSMLRFQVQPVRSVPVNPEIKAVKLPFYDVQAELLKPGVGVIKLFLMYKPLEITVVLFQFQGGRLTGLK